MKPATTLSGRRTRVRRRVTAALGILGIAALACGQVQTARALVPTSTLTTLGSVPNPSTFGEYVTLTATVFPQSSSPVPTGTVSFYEELVPNVLSNHLGDATLTAAGPNGTASLALNTLSVGSHNLVAVYNGDAANLTSQSSVVSQTVNQASTSTALTSSKNPSTLADSVTFTATVTSTGGTPTGAVTFDDGGSPIGTGTLDGSGTATFATSALTLGSHAITATYGGDTNFTGSSSATVNQLVRAASTTALTAAPNPQTYGATVTLTATVSGSNGTPTGTVTFKDGASAIGSPVTLDNTGKAVLASTALGTGGHNLTAVYSGDTGYSGSTSPVVAQGVSQATPTTVLGASVNPAPVNTSVDLTTTVTGPGGAPAAPTGSVTVKEGTTVIGSASLTGGHATVSTSSLALGSHSLTAYYSGDTNYAATTATLALVVKNGSATALSASPSPGISGQAVILTATVTGSAGTPTGTVTFKDGSATVGSPASLDGGGQASITTSALAAGPHSLTAVYSGDVTYAASTSATTSETVLDLTTTALGSSPNPSAFGQAVTITATVSGTTLAGTPTGTVSFLDGGAPVGGPVALDGTGTATISLSTLAVGAHQLTAVYGGDAAYNGSTAPALTQTVDQAASTTVLASGTNPSTYGGSVTFTATVAAKAPGVGTPTGSVTFLDGGTPVGSPVALSGGTATYTTSALAAGSHIITAVYGGDASFTGSSTATSLTQTVNRAATATAVTSPAGGGSSGYGASVTLTATVSGSGATGTVTFKSGATVLAGPLALTAGHVTATVPALAVGSYSITAVYGGDANFLASTSTAVAYSVTQGTSTTSLTFSPTSPVFGQPVTLTATLSGAGGGSYSGTVTFKDGSTVLGSPVTPTGATATLTISSLAVGAHSVTATYAGDPNLAGSTSAAAAVTVAKAATTTTLASSANPSPEGQVTYTATVAVTAPGAGSPGATVAFSDGGSSVAACAAQPVASGKATCTVTYTAPASHTITAAYAGDGSFAASSSATLNQTITGPAGVSVNLQSHALAANGRATTQVYAQLKDSQGNNLAYAGDTVTFTSSAGLTFTDASGATTTNTAVTNASGLATVKVVASTHAGTVVITATTADNPALTNSDHLKLTGSHFGATTLSQSQIAADGHSTTVATAQVLDGAGNPVSGESVNFASSGASVAQPSVLTDSNGNASDTVTSSTTPGTDPVTLADGNFVDNPSTTLALTLLPAAGPSNSSFIHNAYVTMLGRDVDPGAYSYWLGALNSGTSRSALAMALATSGEYRTDVISGTPTIQGFYLEYLGRPSDPAGAAYWVSQMANGMTFEQVRLQFVGSPEYFIHHNSDPGQTIDALYNDILGRSDATDPAGKAYWLANFNVNTIAAQFLYSYEGRAHLVDSYYASILHRGPDAAGLAYWTQAILGGASDENVIADFLSSREYFLSH